MKRKKSLNLFNQNKSKLNKKQAASIKGGGDGVYGCSCGCFYAGQGGSSSGDNAVANTDAGKRSIPPQQQ